MTESVGRNRSGGNISLLLARRHAPVDAMAFVQVAQPLERRWGKRGIRRRFWLGQAQKTSAQPTRMTALRYAGGNIWLLLTCSI